MSEATAQDDTGRRTRPRRRRRSAPAATPQPDPPADRRPLLRRPGFLVFLCVLAALAVAGGIYYAYARQFEDTDDAFIDGHVVPINPQVPALVAAVHIDDNTPGEAGRPAGRAGPDRLPGRRSLQAQGSEAASRGKLEQAKSGVPSAESAVNEARAEVDSAQVNFDNADRDLKRYQGLDAAGQEPAAAGQRHGRPEAGQRRPGAGQGEAGHGPVAGGDGPGERDGRRGRFAEGPGRHERARTNLGYCQVRAPTDGRVTSKSVDPGMYVTTASQLFQLVPTDVWVTANFKETQLDHMRPGQPVSISVDAYPDRDFRGTVQSIQSGTGSRFSVIPAENATGNFVKVVQRVPVKITFDGDANNDPAHLLSPGMSVEPKVRIR